MLIRAKFLILLCATAVSFSSVRAQSIDYLRHNKYFYLCGYERDCSGCYDCEMQKHTVRIKNRSEKQIKQISYVYYSAPRNKVVTKQATIIGSVIDNNQVGVLNICIPNGLHWAISEVVYTDDSKVAFVVKDRLDEFVQEADECDCNKRTVLPNPNIK